MSTNNQDMHRLGLLLIMLFLNMFVISGQTLVQSTIKKQSANCVEIFAKPDGSIDATPFQMIISVRWIDQSPDIIDVEISDLILGMVSTSLPQHTEGGFTYQDFIIDNSITTPEVNWLVDNEYKVAKVCFSGDSDATELVQQVSDDIEGGNGWVFWYINFEVLDDLTNYSTPFYASPGESIANNSGSIKWAETMQQIALPLEVISFGVHKENDFSARINWKTNEYDNIKEFVLQRSNSKIEWQDITSVLPVKENQIEKNYSYLDEDVYDGYGGKLFYYRLKIIDNNGLISNSMIDFIFFNSYLENNTLVLYPNPTSGELNFSMQEVKDQSPISLEIYDIEGKLLYRDNRPYSSGRNRVYDIDELNLKSGVYQLIVEDDSKQRYYKKFVYQK